LDYWHDVAFQSNEAEEGFGCSFTCPWGGKFALNNIYTCGKKRFYLFQGNEASDSESQSLLP
jgi:hypothetical protein